MTINRCFVLCSVFLAEIASAMPPREGPVAYSIIRNKVSKAGQEVGDLVAFDLRRPEKGVVIGNTALTQVGAMDFFRGQLWAASARDDRLSFYTVELQTAEVNYRSTADRKLSGVFAGEFDPWGRFWIVNLRAKLLCAYDPNTGVELSCVPLPSDAGYNGIAFVGEVLYAVRGGTGDPPQEFGTLDTATGDFTAIGYTNVGLNGKGGGNGCGALDYDADSRTMYMVYREGIGGTVVETTSDAAPAQLESPYQDDAQKNPSAPPRTTPQLWSLYTIDIKTGQSTFVGEIGPRATYDSLAIQ